VEDLGEKVVISGYGNTNVWRGLRQSVFVDETGHKLNFQIRSAKTSASWMQLTASGEAHMVLFGFNRTFPEKSC
jgi:hypothetical protein